MFLWYFVFFSVFSVNQSISVAYPEEGKAFFSGHLSGFYSKIPSKFTSYKICSAIKR